MITLTTEQAQLIEEALLDWKENFQNHWDLSDKQALAAIRAVLVDTVDTSEECVDETVECGHEPVAWLFQHEETGLTECVDRQQVEWGFEKNNPRWQKIRPLYDHAPQPRQWIDLTDDEINEVYEKWGALPYLAAIHTVIAAFKEKQLST